MLLACIRINDLNIRIRVGYKVVKHKRLLIEVKVGLN